MKQYDTYKDSGVQWLGEIPGHWGCVFINRLFNIKAGGDVKPELYADKKDENHPFPVYTNTKSADDVYAYTSLATCPSNSITVTGRGEVGHAIFRETPYDAIVRLLSLTPKSNIICKFYAYFIDTVIPFSSDSAAIGQLSAVQIKQKHVTLPPLSEQRSIVSFLDAKCGKIDEWVTKKQKEVEHLQELKQRVIADAVTQGLNPHVKMKATNILWLREIPGNWECVPLKRLIKKIESGVSANGSTSQAASGNELGVLKTGCVSFRVFNPLQNKLVVGEECKRLACPVRGNTIIVSRMNTPELVGSCAFVDKDYPNLFLPDRLWQVYFRDKSSTKFLHWMLNSQPVRNRYAQICVGSSSTMQNISQSQFSETIIPLPPLSEQKQIVSYLDAKCAKIDKLIANITKEIDCIKEYKQRLISDVVTGQIKVC